MTGSYTVYKHTSPSGKVYIGITCQKPERRWGRDGSGYKHSPHFMAAIKRYGWENIRHEILATELSRAAACLMEVELIAEYGSSNPEKGYNLSTGGDKSAAGVKRTPDVCKKIGDIHRGKHVSEETREKLRAAASGKHPSAETRQKLSAASKGRPVSEETRQKISQAHKGLRPGPETRKKLSAMRRGENSPNWGRPSPHRKPVKCVETGQVFPSALSVQQQTGIAQGTVSAVCKGKGKTAGGYHWQYAEGAVE